MARHAIYQDAPHQAARKAASLYRGTPFNATKHSVLLALDAEIRRRYDTTLYTRKGKANLTRQLVAYDTELRSLVIKLWSFYAADHPNELSAVNAQLHSWSCPGLKLGLTLETDTDFADVLDAKTLHTLKRRRHSNLKC